MLHALLTLLAAPLLRWLATRRLAGEPTHILVIQLAKIGDQIVSTPVYRALKERFPQATLSVLANPVTAPLLRVNPRVDRVIELRAADLKGWRGKLRLVRLLRAGGYDTVICLNVAAAYPTCALWALVPRRLGLLPNFPARSYRFAARYWTAVVEHDGTRLIQETYALLLYRLGVTPCSIDKEIYSRNVDLGDVDGLRQRGNIRLVGIGISAANKLKELGADKLAEVVRLLLAREPDVHVLLIGSEADGDEAGRIMARVGGDSRVNSVCGLFALDQLPRLLECLEVYVGVDSGVTYMADAAKIPVVSVAGPCNMLETRPLHPKAIILQEHLPCSPCAHIFSTPYFCATGDHACIERISAARIADAIMQSLPKKLNR